MVRGELGALAALLVVAEERSFTRAARRLEVSPSALSHAMRRLEEQIGVRRSRTTPSVAPTEAGEELLASLRPALSDIQGALARLSGQRARPTGRLRLLVPRLAAMSILAPKLGQFARDYRHGNGRSVPGPRDADTCARGLVSAFPWFLPLLLEPAAAARRAHGTDRDALSPGPGARTVTDDRRAIKALLRP
jgi:DNA-binding transcriptional LysR family regulator